MKLLSKIKYPLLKLIDISGLTFIAPVVRLCYGEEPQVQLKKIIQWIVIPLLAIIVFVIIWHIMAGKIKTKSGTLPTPAETYASYKQIDQIHDREMLKEEAYILKGDDRKQRIKEVKTNLEIAAKDLTIANTLAAEALEKKKESLAKLLKPITDEYTRVRDISKAEANTRETEIKAIADTLTPGDKKSYALFIGKVQASRELDNLAKERRNKIKERRKEIEETKFPHYEASLSEQTRAAETKSFLESKGACQLKETDSSPTSLSLTKSTKTLICIYPYIHIYTWDL